MFREKVLCSMLFAAAMIVLDAWLLPAAEQQGIISKVTDGSGASCFLRFPAIREETLYWPQPVLKDPSSGDIVSFYGPCDHDPLGRLEIIRQRDEYQRRQRRLPAGD
jgi:hypothetical protein